MSLSPFDSFQSQFVTYLLNRPRICLCIFGINNKLVILFLRYSHKLR